MTIILIITIIFLIILILQFEIKSKISYNIVTNTGTFNIKFLNITIIKHVFSFKKGFVEIITKNKQKLIPFDLNRESIKEVSKLDEFLFSKIFFKRVSIYINVGLKNKPYETALLTGFTNVILANTLVALKNAKSEVLESIRIYNSLDKTEFNITLKFKISVSLIDIIWCIVENLAFKQIYKNTKEKNE